MEKLISFLNKLHPLSGSLEAEVRNSFRFVQKKKNTFLLHEGEVYRHIWFLETGLVHGYFERNGHEVTIWFLAENNFVTLFESLWRQKRSLFAIQALEPCILYGIHLDRLRPVVKEHPVLIQAGH